MRPRLGRGWAVVAAASGTVVIGAGAFWLSFTALADLAARSGIPVGQAWIWPLLVDGLIVVATVAVVALDGHRTAWYPWSLLIAGALVSVTANAAHAMVAAIVSVPAVMAATVASVPPLVLLASTHLTVILIRSTKPDPTTPPPADIPAMELSHRLVPGGQSPALTDDPTVEPETAEDEPASEPVPETAPELGAEPEPPEDHPSQDEAVQDERSEDETPATVPVSETASDRATEPPSDSVPGRETEPQWPTPPAAVATEPDPPPGGQQVGRRARAEVLREAGWSNKAIARELGVHASTVGRWFPRTTTARHLPEGAES